MQSPIKPQQSFQQKEKFQTLLFHQYNKALACLKNQKTQEGIAHFQQILDSPMIQEAELRKLKKSVLLSLANLTSFKKDYNSALGYYFNAIQIEKSIIIDQEESFDPNKTLSIEYITLLKMYELTEKMSYHQQSIYLLKRALSVSPDMWRQKVYSLLKNKYASLKMTEQLQDLIRVHKNPTLFRKIIIEEQQKRYKKQQQVEIVVDEQQNLIAAEEQILRKPSNFIKTLKIEIKEKNQSYSYFQYLFTVCYVLLKCQRKRNFNRKRYLHKKYDSNNIEWNQFLSEFDVMKTKIQIVFQNPVVNQNEEPQKQKQDSQNQQNNDKPIAVSIIQEQNNNEIKSKKSNQILIKELTKQLLRIKYVKKKKSKAKNLLQNTTSNQTIQQQTEMNIMQKQKSNKYQNQQKSVYESIKQYYSQNCQKNNFKIDQLQWLKLISQESYNKIIKKSFEQQTDQSDNNGEASSQLPKPDKNIVKNNEVKPISTMNKIENQKQQKQQKQSEKKPSTKDKKQLLHQKIEHHNEQFQEFLKEKFVFSNESQINDSINISFYNICELVQQMINWILSLANGQTKNSQLPESVHHDQAVQKLASKCILKMMPLYGGYFVDYYMDGHKKQLSIRSVGFIQLLVNHYISMSLKMDKNTQFTPHQKQKINYLKNKIIKSFQINVKLLQPVTDSIQRSSILAMWSRQMVRFFMCKTNYDQQAVNYYKSIVIFYHKHGTKLLQSNQSKFIYQDYLMATSQFNIQTLIVEMSKPLVQQNIAVPFVPKASTQDQLESLIKTLQSNSTQSISEDDPIFQRLSLTFQKYFTNLDDQSKTMEQFSMKFLEYMTKKMKIDRIIESLYQKFTNSNSGIVKCFQKYQKKQDIMIYLIKLCLLCSLQSNDDCLRIIFFLTNLIYKGMSNQQKLHNSQLFKLIILYNNLIQFSDKKQKLLNRTTILKKFYQNVISKSLTTIYSDDFQVWKENSRKRQVWNQSSKNNTILQEGTDLVDKELMEKYNLLDKIMDIINSIYFSIDFTPKRLQDSIGFFLFLSRNYSEQFHCQQLQLTTPVVKLFKKCYQVFNQKRKDLFEYCQKYKSFSERMDRAWESGYEKQSQQFSEILKGKKQICDCCSSEKINKQFNYKQVVFILAKFFQSHPYQNPKQSLNSQNKQQQSINFSSLDQKYYKQYLLLDTNSTQAWINYIRIHCLKAYFYFDSLVAPQPIQSLKNKFLFTKRIINFVKVSLIEQSNNTNIDVQNQSSHTKKIKPLQNFITRTLNTLNVLKVKQRQFFMVLKKIQTNFNAQQSKELVKKYQQGLKTISSKYNSLDNITSIYLGLTELVLIQVRFTQLGPGKLQGIVRSMKKIKTVILDLQRHEKQQQENAVHLQEDLIVQVVILICKTIDKIIEKFIKYTIDSHNIYESELNGYKMFMDYLLHPENQIAKQDKYLLKFQNNNSIAQNQTIQEDDNDNDKKQPYNQQEDVQESNREKQRAIDLDKQDSSSDKEQMDEQESNAKEKQKQFKFKPLQNYQEKLKPNKNDTQKQKQKKSKIKINLIQYVQRIVNSKSDSPKVLPPKMIQILQMMTTYFNGVCTLFKALPRYQLKRFKNRRSVTTALQYISCMYLRYLVEPSPALDIIKDYYNIRLDDIVFIYTHSRQKVSTEKNTRLSQFYNRALVHNLHRLSFIEHLVNCFQKTQNIQSLIVLIRKINKMMVSTLPEEQNKQIKYLVMLYWLSVDSYMVLVEKFALQNPLQERYEKLLVEFKNRIKKSIQNMVDSRQSQKPNKVMSASDLKTQKQKAIKQNRYYERVDRFIKEYEKKYDRKVKLKKSKKQREQEKQVKQKDKQKEKQKQKDQNNQKQKQSLQQEVILNEAQFQMDKLQQKQNNDQLIQDKQEQILIEEKSSINYNPIEIILDDEEQKNSHQKQIEPIIANNKEIFKEKKLEQSRPSLLQDKQQKKEKVKENSQISKKKQLKFKKAQKKENQNDTKKQRQDEQKINKDKQIDRQNSKQYTQKNLGQENKQQSKQMDISNNEKFKKVINIEKEKKIISIQKISANPKQRQIISLESSGQQELLDKVKKYKKTE